MKKKIVDYIFDYFTKVILPTCYISGYEVEVILDTDNNDTRTFSVKVNFPYRYINLYINEEGVKLYKKKAYGEIRKRLFHECFHILLWKYKEYAEARFAQRETMEEMEEDMADRFSIILENLWQKQIKQK